MGLWSALKMLFHSKSFTLKQKRQTKSDDGDKEKDRKPNIKQKQENKQLVKESEGKVEE